MTNLLVYCLCGFVICLMFIVIIVDCLIVECYIFVNRLFIILIWFGYGNFNMVEFVKWRKIKENINVYKVKRIEVFK